MRLLDFFKLGALAQVTVAAQCPKIFDHGLAVMRPRNYMIDVKHDRRINSRSSTAKNTTEAIPFENGVAKT